MARVVFPSYDVQTVEGVGGGVGSFIAHLAPKLRERGDEVTIILATGGDTPKRVDPEWAARYRAWGIEVKELHNEPWSRTRWPDVWVAKLSERLTPLLRGFDVAYFADWGNLGFDAIRARRQGDGDLPVSVTVLHGPMNWVNIGDKRYPETAEALNIEFLERYAAEHSDFVAAPSRSIVDWCRGEGWRFAAEPRVLGLPYWPAADVKRPAGIATAPTFKRIVFFGRLETRKGFQLFGEGMARLAARDPKALRGVEEIVLLGAEREAGALDGLRRKLAVTRLPVTHLSGVDTFAARAYLAAHAADALVVMPSRVENFPYVVIEASLVHGLNFLTSRIGGTPEILGADAPSLFDPAADALAAKIRERLAAPMPADRLPIYDFAAANRRWFAFHDEVSAVAAAHRGRPPAVAPVSSPAIDVCVAHYNKGRHFPQLCACLERQTLQDFRVIAVDDGSTDPDAIATFNAMARRYEPRGWRFIRQENRFVDAARNRAARDATADYLLMIDADDACPPQALERLLGAARSAGVDYLAPKTGYFRGDELPFDAATGAVTAAVEATGHPLGASVIAALLDPAVLGGSMALIRRAAFEAVGGYRELRGVGHEDWELHLRFTFAGFKTDALPEFLHFYRQSDRSLSHEVDVFDAKRRLLETYDRRFADVGMYGVANAIVGLQRRVEALQAEVWALQERPRSAMRKAADLSINGARTLLPIPLRALRRWLRRAERP